MTDTHLLTTIRQVRRRWRLALLLRGAAICVAAALVLVAISAIGFWRFGFAPQTVVAIRLSVAVTALIVLVITIVRPLLQRVSDARVALYIEERVPELRALLISAVETTEQNSLTRAMIDRAASECRRLNYGRQIEQSRLRRNGLVFVAAGAIAIMIMAAGPPALRNASSALLHTPEVAAAGVMSIGVLPGSDTIARGADFTIHAELRGFAGEDAFVVVKSEDGSWRRSPMADAQKKNAFEAVLFNVQRPTEYYVESATVRSPVYRVNVVDAPYVKGLALEYVYPAYTGMAPQRVENGGDIVAPRGTVVHVIASTSADAAEARLHLSGAPAIAMQPVAARTLQGSLRVLRDGLYHVELPDIDGRFTSASAQYAITAIADQAPVVTVEKPGRDVKVTAVDEVFVSARAQDDYGVQTLELVYSVNGGAQQTKALSQTQARSVNGAYTFMLEDYSLQPGDVVSYFVRATDNDAIDGAHIATSDIFFIQIRPFSRNYRAAEQAAAPGNGAENEDPGALSERQRQVIAATFNATRDSATYNDAGYAQAINTIALAQQRLREQVSTLVQRMQQRGVASMDSLFAKIAQLLPQAAREMADAESKLQQKQPRDAIAPEQRALQQLTRAEALYKDVQIQMQQQQQPGGGSGNSMPQDLADLFELERNQLRNQYEQVQRSTQQQAQQQVDEALQRLRELAQRQQSAANQGSGAQRRLADETEQAARQLERLARENRTQALADAAQSLQQAADAMRRSSAQQNGRGTSESAAARQRLEDARRRLQQNQQDNLQQQIGEARRRAEDLRAQQSRIAQDSSLNAQRRSLEQGVGQLESQLDRMSAEARSSNPRASREVASAADAIRDSRLRERIRAAEMGAQTRSREFNRAQDEQIGRDLDRIAQQLQSAEQAAGSNSREARAQAGAENARRLAESVEGMRERAGQGGSAGSRQLRAEAGARRGQMRDLQRQLQQDGMPSQQMQDALDAMNAADNAIARGGSRAEIEKLLARAAQGLEDVEFNLRQVAQSDASQRLFTNGQQPVPAQFRKAVAEYYRSLSTGKK